MYYCKLYLYMAMILFGLSCGPGKEVQERATEPLVVYKTGDDYRNLVTVQLSSDGRSVVAYPAPSDVLFQRPIELADGYLLKRMVGNAYISLSIDAYASASQGYTTEELHRMIIDSRPYREIYDCSSCTDGDTASINRLIREGRLRECKSLQ